MVRLLSLSVNAPLTEIIDQREDQIRRLRARRSSGGWRNKRKRSHCQQRHGSLTPSCQPARLCTPALTGHVYAAGRRGALIVRQRARGGFSRSSSAQLHLFQCPGIVFMSLLRNALPGSNPAAGGASCVSLRGRGPWLARHRLRLWVPAGAGQLALRTWRRRRRRWSWGLYEGGGGGEMLLLTMPEGDSKGYL